MSSSEGVCILDPTEIHRDKDVVIEDRMIVAVGSQDETRQSNKAQKTSFYSKLIEVCADKLRAQGNWEVERLMRAAENMVDIVVKQRKGRFIWLKQLPVQQYVALPRKLAIEKLANDLKCQLRKLEAADRRIELTSSPPKTPATQNMKYAVKLINTVCKGLQSGLSPYEATRVLDQPLQKQISPLICVVNNRKKEESRDETGRERRIRLLLRKRFFAVARTNTSLFVFARSLLDAWGISVPGSDSLKKSKEHYTKTAENVSSAEQTVHGFPPSLLIPLSSQKKALKSKLKQPTGKRDSWTLDERKIFLIGLEQFGIGFWKEIAPMLPKRKPSQVAAFGRYVSVKFNLKRGDVLREDARSYLLRADQPVLQKAISTIQKEITASS